MLTYRIILSKTLVFERVSLVTAYHGVRNDGGPCYDRVTIVEADRPWLDTTLCHAVQHLRHLLAPFLVASPVDPDVPFSLLLRVPPSVTPSLLDHWRVLCQEYLEAVALAEWFAICAPAMAPPYRSQRDDCWQRLSTSVKLHHRGVRTRLPPI